MKNLLYGRISLLCAFLALFCIAPMQASNKAKAKRAKKLQAKAAEELLNNQNLPASMKAIMFSDTQALEAALVHEKQEHISGLLLVAQQALNIATQKGMAPQIAIAKFNIELLEQAQKGNKKEADKKMSKDAAQDKQKKSDSQKAQEKSVEGSAAAGSGADAVGAQDKAAMKDDKAKNMKLEAAESLAVQHAAAGSAAGQTAAHAHADAKANTEYAAELNDEIIRAYHRLENAMNLFLFMQTTGKSDLKKYYAALLLQEVVKQYLFLFKAHGKPFGDALTVLQNLSYTSFIMMFVQCLAVTNPAHAKKDAPELAGGYVEKVLKKMFNDMQLQSGINDLYSIIDCACLDVWKIAEGSVEAQKIMSKDPACANLDLGSFKCVGDEMLYDPKDKGFPMDFSLERLGGLIKNTLENHQENLRASLATVKEINALGSANLPLLLCAVLNNIPEDVECLLKEFKANPNIRDRYGVVPLLLVSDPQIKKMLVAAGSSIDFRDGQGKTPLMTACEMGHKKVVEALLSAGANYQLTDKAGRTAYALTHNQDVLAVLEACGAGAFEKERLAVIAALEKENLNKQELERLEKEAAARKLEAQALRKEQRKKEKKDRRAVRKDQAVVMQQKLDKLESILNRTQTKIKSTAFSRINGFVKKQREQEKEQKLARERRIAQGLLKLENALSRNSKRVVLHKWQAVNKHMVLDNEACNKVDNDLLLRSQALQKSIELYQKHRAQDPQSYLTITNQAEANLISAGVRLIDYYVQKGLSMVAVLAAMQKCQITIAQVAAAQAHHVKCRFDLLEAMFKALDKAAHFKRGQTIQDMVCTLAELSKQTQIAEFDGLLIDAIRADDAALVIQLLKNHNGVKFDVPLLYAALFERQIITGHITEYMRAQRSKKIDPKALAERLRLVEQGIAQRNNGGTAAAGK